MTAAFDTAVRTMRADAFTVPTDQPESDGTLAWDSTTVVVVEVACGDAVGIGYSYTDRAAADLIHGHLRDVVQGHDALDTGAVWVAMVAKLRNLGRPGLVSSAIAAVDIALWDLKAKLLDVPISRLAGGFHDAVPIYGSGGFTSYSTSTLQEQLADWVAAGIPRVKMKIGRSPQEDVHRVEAARDAVGADTELYVDANGAYHRKQALAWGERLAELGVSWFEEPVSSDDLAGLRLLRDRAPAGMDITAGEYGYDLPYFQRMIDAGAVDCLQADVTRCAGITGFLRVSALCDATGIDLSAHTAPQVSAHACAGVWHLRHLEYFHDHVRLERMLFEGVIEPTADGTLRPDPERPGLGITFKRAVAEKWAA